MKYLSALAAAGLLSFGLVGSASASHFPVVFSPPSTTFTSTGPFAITINGTTLACTGTLKWATNVNGGAKIKAASLSGPSGCSSVAFFSLPWKAVAISAASATIELVDFTTSLGDCRSNLGVTVSNSVLSYTGQFSSCNLQISLTTTPAVSIVPK